MGISVFNGDKIVGELDGLENICHMLVSNNLKYCNLTIPDPIDDDNFIDFHLIPSKKTKVKVYFVNGNPYITCDINVNIKIISATESSTQTNSNYYSSDNIALIEESCNDYLKTIISEYLYKMAKEYKSDIDGFGKYAVKHFATIDEWNEYNWLDNFENSVFNVNVNTTLQSGYSFM
jgi:spore germination protein KC